ncbi:hypothetical protein LTR53_016613 [Teratosphaeriaceae sp. CCFEE 6253]|nr:hypothetical protein LTR53_016613 [Teratosphaeriaceae sp. CCFEE 6253]
MKLEGIPGVVVALHVNGTAMQEYDDNSDELYIPSIGRKYVEAESGSEFDIRFTFQSGAITPPNALDSIRTQVQLDGQWITGTVAEVNNRSSAFKTTIDGKTENFTFATLVTGMRKHHGVYDFTLLTKL